MAKRDTRSAIFKAIKICRDGLESLESIIESMLDADCQLYLDELVSTKENENKPRVLCINFATSKKVGGGFLDFYDVHNNGLDYNFSDSADYSPDVPVFRNDLDKTLLTDGPYKVNIVSMPYVNVIAASAVVRTEDVAIATEKLRWNQINDILNEVFLKCNPNPDHYVGMLVLSSVMSDKYKEDVDKEMYRHDKQIILAESIAVGGIHAVKQFRDQAAENKAEELAELLNEKFRF